ncbi:MAG: TetR/AcrR family transcriptional regulator [Nannocystaceae bacterium]|nr:TetR family transcriptional regulator [Myxococcales bacterium]
MSHDRVQDREDAQGDDPEDPGALLDLAAQLVAREGPDLTMDRLAQAAGISRATLYRRIPGRRALARQLRDERGVELAVRGSTRARILEAAGLEINERGLLAATIERIAERAGVNPVTIYRLYQDRDTLLREVLESRSPRRSAARLLDDCDAPMVETLTAFTRAILAFLHENAGFLRVALFGAGEEVAYIGKLRRAQTGTLVTVARYLEGQMARGRLVADDPRATAFTLIGSVFTDVFLRARLQSFEDPSATPHNPSAAELDARAAAIVHRFLRGAAPRGPGE